MPAFAAALLGRDGRWRAEEVSLEDCESVDDAADLLRDFPEPTRLLVVEQDDAYAVLLRLDASDDYPRVFLSDGHAADEFALAALFADQLDEIGEDELADGVLPDDVDAPAVHDGAPYGDAAVVADLGTSPDELLALCAKAGELPVDMLFAVAEAAGAGAAFEDVRG